MGGVEDAGHQMTQLDHEQPAIDHLGNDQAKVERGLNPATGEDEGLKGFDGRTHFGNRKLGSRILSRDPAASGTT
jgi:hypothetical protein